MQRRSINIALLRSEGVSPNLETNEWVVRQLEHQTCLSGKKK
jgi:hypothetical protein